MARMPSTSKPTNGDRLSHFRGHAGEMYVSAELMRRGWLAAMTARGSQSFDILARRADRPVFTAIRVKTGHGSFLWSAKKDGTIFLDMTDTRDFTVIVDLPDTGTPIYYVIPTTVVERELSQLQSTWLRTPWQCRRVCLLERSLNRVCLRVNVPLGNRDRGMSRDSRQREHVTARLC